MYNAEHAPARSFTLCAAAKAAAVAQATHDVVNLQGQAKPVLRHAVLGPKNGKSGLRAVPAERCTEGCNGRGTCYNTGSKHWCRCMTGARPDC